MALVFPTNPTQGQVYNAPNGVSYSWNGQEWVGSFPNYPNSKTTVGYQVLPGGTIIQWGFGTTGAGGQLPITFPVAFPSVCASVVITEINAVGWGSGTVKEPTIYATITPPTRTGFTCIGVRIKPITGAVTEPGLGFQWQAVGY